MGREYVSNADELKKQLRAVEGRRADIEAELRSCFDRLPEDPGLNGPLIDREGFPRADVDIPLVREVRQKIIRLRNDQKQLTEELDTLLQQYFAATASGQRQSKGGAMASDLLLRQEEQGTAQNAPASAMNRSLGPGRGPFATVDRVSAGCPAGEGGLQQGDRILQFGGATDSLAAVSKQVTEGEGQRLEVEVLRRGEIVQLYITPHRWTGRGLLGASFSPL